MCFFFRNSIWLKGNELKLSICINLKDNVKMELDESELADCGNLKLKLLTSDYDEIFFAPQNPNEWTQLGKMEKWVVPSSVENNNDPIDELVRLLLFYF